MLVTLPNMSETSKFLATGIKNGNYGIGNMPAFTKSNYQPLPFNNPTNSSKTMEVDIDSTNKTLKKRLSPEGGRDNNDTSKKSRLESNLQEEIFGQLKDQDEKIREEISLENVWKFNMKTRRKFMCNNTPTIVITPIKAREIKSETSVIKFLGLKNRNQLTKKIIRHTFSGDFRTIFIHFSRDVNEQHLIQLVENFNNSHIQQEEMKVGDDQQEEKINKKEQKHQKQPRCQLFRKEFAEEQKKRREEAVLNPEINKNVLLRNVPVCETEEQIKSILEEYGYEIQEVKRFKNLPMVRVQLSKSEDVSKILEDKDIQIGYSIAEPQPFDKNKSRPKSHFKQCKKCWRLNHIHTECQKKRSICKFCGFANHIGKDCPHKHNSAKHFCVLCKKQHPSDSIQCERIQSVRKGLGIKLTRWEMAFLEKKKNSKSQSQFQFQTQNQTVKFKNNNKRKGNKPKNDSKSFKDIAKKSGSGSGNENKSNYRWKWKWKWKQTKTKRSKEKKPNSYTKI